MSTFVLQILDLDESGRDWNFAIGTDWLASALADTELNAGTEDGQLTVHAQRSGMDVLVQGHIEAEVAATCARCLADVSLDVDLALTALFSPEHTRPKGSEEIDVPAGRGQPGLLRRQRSRVGPDGARVLAARSADETTLLRGLRGNRRSGASSAS